MFKRIASYVRGIGKAILNRYEGAWQRWGERSWLPQTYQDARLDADSSTRIELQRRHRYWVKNSDLVHRIRNLFVQFSVGVSGLQVVPNSDDENWNHARQHSWQDWGRSPSVDNNLSLGQSCIQWAGALFDDGEVFILKTTQDQITKGGAIRRIPGIRTIAANRVGTPPDRRLEEGKNIWDGVRIDKFGKPQGYFIKDDTGEYKEFAASDVIHIFKAREPGMLRGIPEGFSAMNTLHDFEDLHLLEMQAAKMAAELAVIETNPTGEFDSTATRRSRVGVSTTNTASQYVTKNADTVYQLTMGAKKYALKSGDSIKNFQVDRPSVVQQQYWDFLVGRICCSYNTPKLLVVPYSLQGTVTRADLDICANAFRFNFELMADAMQKIYEWQTEWALRFDRSIDGEPENAMACIIRPPRAPNVDIGYTAQALAIELKSGTKTLQDVYAERQQDWRHQLRQIAETRAYINELAEEFGISPDEISQTAEKAAPSEPDGDEGKGEDESEPEEKPETEKETETADA